MRDFPVEQKTTRDAFGAAVLDLAKEDDTIMAVGADTVYSLGMKEFEAQYPDRVYNVGIAEQNMMATCSGLAATGFRPYACTYAPFTTMRALEQFRTFCCYPNLNVQVAGGMGGLAAAEEGVTHQCAEDLAIMRSIPGTVVISPADYASTYAIVKALGNYEGQVYYRFGKLAFRKVFDENYKFELGKANLLEEGTDLTIICHGTMVARSLQAYDLLLEKGIKARVLEMPCIKPIDEDAILAAAKETGRILTVEEAVLHGSMGSAVAEVLSEKCPTLLKRMGINDCFAQSGKHELLLDEYGLSVQDIVDAAVELSNK